MRFYQTPGFRALEREWYEKIRAQGFDDLETARGFIKVDIHPHYRDLAFKEKAIRSHYTEMAQSFLWDFDFTNARHKQIWENHVNGVPIRKIGQLLGLTRNQVWPVIKQLRQKVRVKYMEDIKIRPYRPGPGEDYAFVKATWLHSYKHSSPFAKRIRHSVFYFWHARLVDSILARPTTRVVVATLPDEPDVILGYLVLENESTIHYMFVKDCWRKLGIGRALFAAAGPTPTGALQEIYFTHWTDPVDSLINKKSLKGLVYDPYRI